MRLGSLLDRRRAGATLLVLALAVLAGGVFWHGYQSERLNALELRTRIAEQEAALRERVRAAIGELRPLAENPAGVHRAASVPRAAASLQAQLAALVDSAGGRVNSTRLLGHETGPAFERVTVRVQLSAAIDALRQLLYALARTEPALVPVRLEIAGDTGGDWRASPVPLSVTVDVTGVVQLTGPSPSNAVDETR